MSYKFLIFAIVIVLCLWINRGEAIKGGKPADISKYPYVVAIMMGSKFVCSGAIIHEQYVITAATCLIDESGNLIDRYVAVIVGVTEVFQEYEFGQPIISKEYDLNDKPIKRVAAVIYPKSYNKTNNRFMQDYTEDYLFLKLEERLDFTSKVQKIGFGDSNKVMSSNVMVAGYGYDNAESNGPVRLKELETTIVPHHLLRKDKAVDNSVIVAYTFNREDGKNQGPCEGDLGAPLIDNTTLVGILVAGPSDCGIENEFYYYRRMPTVDRMFYFPGRSDFLNHYSEIQNRWV